MQRSLPFLFFACAAWVVAGEPLAEAQEGLRHLLAQREKALAQLPKDARELRLSLEGAADRDDAEVALRQRAGAWIGGYAQVPGWGQATMPEWRRYYLGNRSDANWRDGLPFAVDASGLTWSDAALTGDLVVTYRYDTPEAVRVPSGKMVNFWDRFVSSGNTIERKVIHRIDAAILPDSWLVELVLEDGVTWPVKPRASKPKNATGDAEKDAKAAAAQAAQREAKAAAEAQATSRFITKIETPAPPAVQEEANAPTRVPVVLRLRLPSGPTTPVRAVTPLWLAGYHEADASGLVLKGTKLTGTVTVYLHQDGWSPWGGGKNWQVQPTPATYRIDADLAGGAITGTYAAQGVPTDLTLSSQNFGVTAMPNPLGSWNGRVMGRAGRLVAGRHGTTGDLGSSAGAVLGSVEISGGPGPSPTVPNDVAGCAQAAESVLADLRALALIQSNPGFAWHRARVQTDLARTDWAVADPAVAAGWISRSVRWYSAPPAPLPPALPETGSDSLSLGSASCAGVLPATGWHHLATWQVSDLLQLRPGIEQDSCPFPDVVPVGLPLLQDADRLGCRRLNPDRREWSILTPPGPTVLLPRSDAPIFPRYSGKVFIAAGNFQLDRTGPVRMALDAADQAQVYLDGRLVWAAPVRSYRTRPGGRQIVTVDLAAGDHQVVVRNHQERISPWFQFALSRDKAQAGPLVKPLEVSVDPRDSAGDPPLSWDLAKDTAWRLPDLAGSTAPLALGGMLYVPTLGRLHAVDPATGTVRWVKDLGAAPADAAKGNKSDRPRPIACDGAVIAGNPLDGSVVRCNPDGSVAWTAATGLGVGVLHKLGDRIIAEGRQLDAKEANAVGVVALDAATGAITGRWDLRGGVGAGAQGAGSISSGGFDASLTAVIQLRSAARLHGVYLSSAGILIDVLDGGGMRLLNVDWPGQWDDGLSRYNGVLVTRSTVAADGADLVLASQMGVHLVTFWPGPDGRLAYGPRWMAGGQNSGHGGFAARAALDGNLVFVWNVIVSHGPHCPDAYVECCAYDRATGRVLIRQNRLHPGMARGGPTTVQGGRLYLCEPGAEPFVFAKLGRITVLSATADLPVIGGGDLDPRSREPLVIGGRLIVRSPEGLYAIARKNDQRQLAARIVLDRLGLPPVPDRAPLLSALDRVPAGADLPVTILADGLAPTRWLGLGPMATPPSDPLALVPGAPGAPAWRSLARNEAWRDPPLYHRQNELQGTGDIIPSFSGHLDPASCASATASGLFYALLDNQRERLVVPRMKGPGLTLWVSGRKLVAGEAVRLAPGLHPVLVQVDPPWFAQTTVTPFPPVDVAKGLAAGLLTSVWPGEWKVAGPISADVPPLDGSQLTTVPSDELAVGQAVVRVHPVPDPDHRLRLTRLVDLAPGQAFDFKDQPATVVIGHPVSAYAFTTVTVPTDGVLYGTAAVDWHMRWFVDGRPAYATQAAGNGGDPEQLGMHPFAIPVTAGKHVVCVELKPGSKGFQLRADLAFSAKTLDELSTIRVESKIKPVPPDLRLDPAFADLPLSSERMAVWLRTAKPLRDVLQSIVTNLPGTREADEAKTALATLASTSGK